MKKILLTGGCGYIGSHTCVELLTSGYDVTIYDNLLNSDKSVLGKIKQITGKTPKFMQGDLLDTVLLDKVFKDGKFDAVIHFAALKAVGESIEKPIEYYTNNVVGSLRLFEAMKKHGVKKIIYSSSATVYGIPEKMPLTEDSPVTHATNPYGETKIMIERILMDIAVADKDFTAVSLRYFNPVGAHESGLIGDYPKGIPLNIAPYIMQTAIGVRPHVDVFGDDYPTPDGTGVRDYIHVVDLVLGHIAALEKIKKPGTHIYNLGTGKGFSVLELIKAFEKAYDKKIPYKVAKRRPGDIAVCYANCDKAKKELGWVATRTIDDMCKSTVKFSLTPTP
ncbi:MAG: UDP-glucose 4-epimerase GalE [Firmicutes bacterium]|nr:UDP-glucose 4-epimerase GalE [Bacillota bacterium]